MNEVFKFLQDCGIFFVSTVDGNQPKVRPFSFVMEYEGKICFATSNQNPSMHNLRLIRMLKSVRHPRISNGCGSAGKLFSAQQNKIRRKRLRSCQCLKICIQQRILLWKFSILKMPLPIFPQCLERAIL